MLLDAMIHTGLDYESPPTIDALVLPSFSDARPFPSHLLPPFGTVGRRTCHPLARDCVGGVGLSIRLVESIFFIGSHLVCTRED